MEIPMETRFGYATQPQDVAVGPSLAAQIQRFQPSLNPWVVMLKTPVAQRIEVRFAERDPAHHQAPSVRVGIKRTMPTLTGGTPESQRKPNGVYLHNPSVEGDMQGRHSARHIALDDATRTTLLGWLRQ
jgi:hypothetical protein